MKIIDLLNKIANGEEVPKKIIINDREWIYDGIDYARESDGKYLFNVFIEITQHDLNVELEILEEEKKIPEKINKISTMSIFDKKNIEEYLRNLFSQQKELMYKLNEVIDYLKSKGE